MGYETEDILSIASWIILLSVVIPVQIRWFMIFWRVRHRFVIRQRRPRMLYAQLVIYWIWLFCDSAMDIFTEFRDDFNISPGTQLMWTNIIGWSTVAALEVLWVGIAFCREWLLFFS